MKPSDDSRHVDLNRVPAPLAYRPVVAREVPVDPLIGLPDPLTMANASGQYGVTAAMPEFTSSSDPSKALPPATGASATGSLAAGIRPPAHKPAAINAPAAIESHDTEAPNRLQSDGQSNLLPTQSFGGPHMSSSLARFSESWPSGPLSPEPMTEVVDIYLQQAEAYCQEKQWEKALNACQEILKVSPDNALAYKFLGKILQQQGRTTDAMGFYAKALTLQPNFPEVYSNLGSLHAKKGQWEVAVDYYKKAIDRDPNFAAAYFNLAKVWKQLGHTDSEMNCLATAFRLQPKLGNAKDYYRLGLALESAQNVEAALDFYQRATAQDAGMVDAYQRMADLLENRGDWQGAAVCYRKVLALNTASDGGSSSAIARSDNAGRSARADDAQINNVKISDARIGNGQISGDQIGGGQTDNAQIAPSLSSDDRQRIQKLIARSSNKRLIQPTAQPAAPFSNQSSNRASDQASLPSAAAPIATPSDLPLLPQSAASLVNADLAALSIDAQRPTPSSSAHALPQSDDLLTQQAQRYAQMQDWPRAIECIQQAIAQAPRSAPLYRTLAKLLERNNASAQAAEAWYRAFMLDPNWPSAEQFVSLGRALGRYSNIAAATRCFNQAIQSTPTFVLAYESLAQLLRSQGNAADADAVLRQMAAKTQLASQSPNLQPFVSQSPNSQSPTASPPTASPPVPSLSTGNGSKRSAHEMPRHSLSAAEIKARSQAMHQRGDELQTQGRLKEALECYQQAVTILQSGDAGGDVRRDTGPDLNSAIAEAQSRSLTAHKQGDAMRELGKFSEAIANYQEAIRLNPHFSWSHHSLGDCYKKLGEYRNAALAYQQAIALNPAFVWSHYSLGETLEQLGEWAEAAASYRQAQQADPSNEQVPPRLADVLRELLQISPRDIDCYQALAEQYVAQGKTEDAIATYQLALQIQPDNTDLAATLAEMLREINPGESHALLDRAFSKIVTPQDICSLEDLAHPKIVFALLKHTHLFDPVYYRATNSALAGLTDEQLLMHYIEQGSAARRSPNPLFDDAFYAAQYPEIAAQGINPLAHYHCSGHQQSSDPHPFFNLTFYRETHEDVAAADIDPLEHYLAYGIQEGRAAFSSQEFAHLLTDRTPVAADYLKVWQGDIPALPTQLLSQKLGIYCNSLGNYFITEIADFIADALTKAGYQVIRLSEQDTPPDDLSEHWVIAPHEFFYLGEGARWKMQQTWLSNAVMVNVEQPQTTWFSKAFHFLRHSKIIFDINVKSAAIMQSLGLPAYWLPLGALSDYTPFSADEQLPDLRAVRGLPTQVGATLPSMKAPLTERPLDIHFIGTLNPRRETFFAQSASWLSQYHCCLHMPHMGVPLLKGQDQALDTATVVGISRRSKILLNIHRDPLPYFEWHRIIFHGLWQNTLVVTEPCHDIPGLVAGEHFVSCELSEMAEKIDWLLNTAAGQAAAERIRWAGRQALLSQFQGTEIMTSALHMARLSLENLTSETATSENVTSENVTSETVMAETVVAEASPLRQANLEPQASKPHNSGHNRLERMFP